MLPCSLAGAYGGVADHIEVADSSAQEERDGFTLRNVTYYSYDSQGRRIAVDRYDSEEELQDGSRVRLEYAGSRLVRLFCSDPEGNALREITFETEAGRGGRIEEWYEPLKEQR